MANRLDGKGSARLVRTAKREEAETRNSRTAPDKRRQYWRDRGFIRQSQAANLVASTVADCNERAKDNRQRSEDWPLLPEEVSGAQKLLLDIFGA
jgi:hypothetical protein